jgi:hypothetical protein
MTTARIAMNRFRGTERKVPPDRLPRECAASLQAVAAAYTVTTRSGARVRKQRHAQLADALRELERAGRELETTADGRAEGGTLMRRLEPVQIVVARLELSGPRRLRAGVDIRGDGSSEAFVGRLRRQVVEGRDGESAYDALRRSLEPSS